MKLETPRLLITDDDPAMRASLQMLFEDRGFQTRLAANGQEAVNIVQEDQIHLLLLDMHMPHMNGLEAVRKIQQLERRIPCILLSARLDEDLAREALQARVFSVLAKPFRLAQIIEMVRGALLTTYGWTPHS